jgi:hypothetical protein
MSAEQDPGIWKTAFDFAWAGVAALGGLVWKSQNEKISAQGEEIKRGRDVQAKLFDKLESTQHDFRDALEAHARRSEERHIELLSVLHSGLAGKVDR